MPTEIGFTVGDRSWERKVKESMVAMQIEKRYTKEEIFTMYCNQIYWGHGAYGVEAASQVYFGKSVGDLTLEEAALIAGIIQGNVRQSPYVNMEAALRRRNYALERMADEGYITREVADATKQKPIVTRGEPAQDSTIAPYFIEEVRKYVEAKYGAKALYENGLTIRTTLDAELQRAANRALDKGLRQVARRRGAWRKPARNILSRRAHARRIPARALVAADGRRRHRPRGRDVGRSARQSRTATARVRFGRLHGGPDARGLSMDAAHARRRARQARRSRSRSGS